MFCLVFGALRLTGFEPAAIARILHSLAQAADEYDANALEQLLGEAFPTAPQPTLGALGFSQAQNRDWKMAQIWKLDSLGS